MTELLNGLISLTTFLVLIGAASWLIWKGREIERGSQSEADKEATRKANEELTKHVDPGQTEKDLRDGRF